MNVLLLDCGHVAAPAEQLRYGPDKWCSTCCQWRPLATPTSDSERGRP